MKPLPFKMKQDTEIERWRASSFWDKEPETIAWINSFGGEDVFYDIGSNIGVFALYCASRHPNSVIYAFEPHPVNYLSLVHNVERNRFKNIRPILSAIGSELDITDFFIPNEQAGASGGQIEKNKDENGNAFLTKLKISIPILTIDGICEVLNLKKPTHIKIDIDGQEKSVLMGMGLMLKSRAFDSLLVEVNSDLEFWLGVFLRYGYTTNNAFNNADNHSRFRRAKEGIKAENIIFTRG